MRQNALIHGTGDDVIPVLYHSILCHPQEDERKTRPLFIPRGSNHFQAPAEAEHFLPPDAIDAHAHVPNMWEEELLLGGLRSGIAS